MQKYVILMLICYIMGILLCPLTTALNVTAMVAAVFFLSAVIKAAASRRVFTPFGVMALFFAMGLLGTLWVSDLPQKSFYPILDQPVTLTARLSDLPEFDGTKVTYRAELLSAEAADGTVTPLSGNVLIFSTANAYRDDKQYRDVIQLKTALTLPDEAMNEGNFDYRRYLSSRGIFVIAYAKEATVRNLGRQPGDFSLLTPIYQFKKAALNKIDTYLFGTEKELVKALLLGVRTHLPAQTQEEFRQTGLSHVLSVSGLHFHMLLLSFGVLLYRLPVKHRRYLRPIFHILLALAVYVLTGAAPSVARAAIMVIIASLAELFLRESNPLYALLVAALVLLLGNPLCLYDVSFQLSFLATLGIVLFTTPLSRRLERIIPWRYARESVSVSLCAQLFTLPVIAYVFNQVAALTILSNLLVIPFLPALMVGALVFLAMAFLLPFGAGYAAGFVFLAARAVLVVVHLLSRIPHSLLVISGKSAVVITGAAAAIGFCIWVLVRSGNGKERFAACCAIGVAVCCALTFSETNSSQLEVTFLNVGQGDCSLVRTPAGQTVLIDGGGSSNPKSDTGKNIILPYLLRRGIRQLDCAVVSHFHDDHTEGILSLLEQFDIGALIVPDCRTTYNPIKGQVLSAAVKRKIPVYYFSAGSRLHMEGGIAMEAFSPQASQFYDGNDSSLVLRLTYGDSDLLFTGDIEAETESTIAPYLPPTDVLKAPHHGSDTSSSPPLLDALQPQLAVISVGKDNQHGHPSPKTLQAYLQRNIRCYRTDQSGTITLTTAADGNWHVHTKKGV